MSEQLKKKPFCRYGEKCYRKNPEHLRDFDHSKKETAVRSSTPDDDDSYNDEPKSKVAKLSPKDDHIDKPDEDLLGLEASVQCPSMETMEDRKKFIKKHFLFDMPNDFYILWRLAKDINPENPCDAFKSVGLTLVGPFLVLNKKFDGGRCVKMSDFLLAWRYYYDVPEFQTVIVGDDSKLFHIGYFRDDPNELPTAVCSNEAAKGCKLSILGDNLIGALYHHLMTISHDSMNDEEKNNCEILTKKLATFATENKFFLGPNSQKLKDRKKKTVAPTFHGLGIVVPVENDVGYRSIGETDANLKKWLKIIDETDEELIRQEKLEKIQELVTYVQFANDECDYGMGLELGVDLFCSGSLHVHGLIYQLLSVAYNLLQRDKFAEILKVHLKNRSKNKPLYL